MCPLTQLLSDVVFSLLLRVLALFFLLILSESLLLLHAIVFQGRSSNLYAP